jgi:hypothetical protein
MAFGKMATLDEDAYLGSFPNLYSAVCARGADGVEGPRLHLTASWRVEVGQSLDVDRSMC